MRRHPTIAAAFIALAGTCPAKVDLVSLPSTDSMELTVYNEANLTLVRESRQLTFAEGGNALQFSWAGVDIVTDSLELDVSSAPGVHVLDTVFRAEVPHTAEWMVTAEEATATQAEVRYMLRDLTWSASITGRLNEDETMMTIQQFTTLHNNSGMDVEDASIRVVVGEPKLAAVLGFLDSLWKREANLGLGHSEVAYAADMTFFEAVITDPFEGDLDDSAMPRDLYKVLKRAVSEYHLFSISGTHDLKVDSTTSLPEPAIANVKVDLSYEYDWHGRRRPGYRFPRKYYKLRNDVDCGLGLAPIPAATWNLTKDDGRGGVSFSGRAQHDYVPIGERIELNMWVDHMLTADVTLQDFQRTNIEFDSIGDVSGWDEVFVRRAEFRNARDRAVPLKYTHHFVMDEEAVSASIPFEQVDLSTIRWELDVPASDTLTIMLETVVHFGTRATSTQGAAP